MNKKPIINKVLLVLSIVISTYTCADESIDSVEDNLGYYYGFTVGNMLKAEGFSNVDDGSFMVGVKDALDGKDARLSQEEAQAIMAVVKQRRESQKASQLAEWKQEGDLFLAINAKKEGVIQTSSGLQYLVVEEGTGPQPSAISTVLAHYKGALIGGKIFDNSFDRDPVEFNLSQVIAGWTEGLQLMKQGGKTQFFIPSDLAYGPGGSRDIPPNSVLVFEVELIEVKD